MVITGNDICNEETNKAFLTTLNAQDKKKKHRGTDEGLDSDFPTASLN